MVDSATPQNSNTTSMQKPRQSNRQPPDKDTTRAFKMSASSQQRLKRQREWVYLTHFLALRQLHPIKTISGSDDGQEPDFTCVFQHKTRKTPYYIGIELTTLPRLRDRLGNENLMLKRWYWQSRLQVCTGFMPSVVDSDTALQASNDFKGTSHQPCPATKASHWYHHLQSINFAARHTVGHRLQQGIAKTMRWLPSAFFEDMTDEDLPIDSLITQADIDAVMQKKAHKIAAYQQKRPLDEVWLLVHTNASQENGVLAVDTAQTLLHHSDFDQVFVTLYPSHQVLQLAR